MALLWVLSMKPDFAIAESLIAREELQTGKERFRSTSILALAMHQNGWINLAASTSKEMDSVLLGDELKEGLYYEKRINYFSYGLLALRQGDNSDARWAFTELGYVVEIHWLPEAVDAILLVKEGQPKEGVAKLKALSQNVTLPEREREYIEKIIAGIEAEAGKLDNDFLVTNVFGNTVFDSILDMDEGMFSEVINTLIVLKENFKK